MMKKYDFKEVEQGVVSLWRNHKNEIDEAISDDNIHNKDRFTFLEGPPTANAPPGLHHVEMRVFKDLFTRFKQLQGYKVSRKGGWDCHGLPVEVQVEKKLGLSSKKEVLKYGVDKFIKECKEDVFRFVGDWTKSTERLGFWVDLENPYQTLDTSYMESVWWALAQMYKKDLVYKGHKIVPYCARCGTPLSSHEVAQGYQDITETTVVMKFPATDKEYFSQFLPSSYQKKDVVFLAWTTTPWTLPSNLALAVHPKVEYVFVAQDDVLYVVAKDLYEKYFTDKQEIVATVLGEKLVGQHYEPLFDYFKEQASHSFRIIPADYVTTDDGTGIVHQAPAYGEEDNVECNKNGIDFVNPVDDNGEFTQEVSDFEGMFVKDADKKIIEHLQQRGKLFSTAPYEHSYPFCWRCKTPLIYYAKETWFIKVSAVKDKLLEENEKINWHPETIKHGRFGNWLEGARDWALSRNKFWGTPLPIWLCENESCEHQEIIGSREELKEKTGVLVDDLHISAVDPLTYTCPKCGGEMKRTPEVIDCWFDSGSAPFAQLHYPFENKELFDELYPYDFIAEAIDQTRGWFYTLLVINTILFDRSPYKSVAVGGLLCDENGEKMSKSKGNIIKPHETFDTYGVDATRLAMASYSLGSNIKYGDGIFKEQIQPFFTTLFNSYVYIKNYVDRFSLEKKWPVAPQELEDTWLLSKTNSMIAFVTKRLENHEYNRALDGVYDFVTNTLSKTYIKLIRPRAQQPDQNLASMLLYALDSALHCLAPFAPFITEHMYQEFLRRENDAWSIHFSSWPKSGDINERLEEDFDKAQAIIQGILAARDKAKQGVRWPLQIVHVLTEQQPLSQGFVDLILEQTNIKQLHFVESFDVEFSFKIDFKKLGDVFGTKTGDVIPVVQKNMDLVTKELNEKESMTLEGWELQRDYFKMEKVVPEPYIIAPFAHGEVYLDTTTTPELEAEGFARELTRRIQQVRKKAGLQPDDVVAVGVSVTDGMLIDAFSEHKDAIMQKVGAKSLDINPSQSFEFEAEQTVRDKTFTVLLSKL